MALYAISDLHLSFSTEKPMDIFGEKWAKHDKCKSDIAYSAIKNSPLLLLLTIIIL